jgi:DNA-binding IclR family transcriptional regulator
LLSELEDLGFLARYGGGMGYRLGPRLLRLLHTGSDLAKLRLAVHGTLEKIADRLGETCFLARLTGSEVVSVAWAVPERGVRGYVFPGHSMPPNAAASAKAILAFQPAKFIDQILAQPLAQLTPVTKTNPDEVRAEYGKVRAQGYALCWDELEVGLGAIACPVELPGVGVMYALGASGVGERLQRRSLETILDELRAAVPDIQRALRHVGDFDAAATAERVGYGIERERGGGRAIAPDEA